MYSSPYHKSHKKSHTFSEHLQNFLQKIPFLGKVIWTKEMQLIALFFLLFAIIIIKLVYLQIIQHPTYDTKLNTQHTRSTSVKANRGDIYARDKSGQPVKLTENLSLYDIALDPTLIGTTTGNISLKGRLIELLTPVVYQHLCVINGMETVTLEGCIKNVEEFTNTELLPKMPQLFYYGSGIKSPEYDTFDFSGFEMRKSQIISGFSETKAQELITIRLHEKIQI
ncbi:MAG: hypothetical protein LBG59_05895 [Candidatus Peribacteria bacterium]|jgi:cell division protein FtsI/penicillin-binding protein 2|nr:hypothetical protein [Candidatus Peribacteria bacterium]